MADHSPVELVIFDMDNVLVDYRLDRRLQYLSALTGLSTEAIHGAIWGADFEHAAEAGAYVTGEEYLLAFNERLKQASSSTEQGSALTREQWIAARREAMDYQSLPQLRTALRNLGLPA